MPLEVITTFATDDEQMPHVFAGPTPIRERNCRVPYLAGVPGGNAVTRCIVRVESSELDAQHRRMHLVEPAVHPAVQVLVFSPRSIVRDRSNRIGESVV